MNLEGTTLKREDIDSKRVLTTRFRSNAFYAWDTGRGIGRYLQGLKAGEIWGTHCDTCNRTVVPPRIFCERCMKNQVSWVKLQDTGIINTFSICYVNWDASRVEEPHLPAVIEIDGASQGHGILHVLDEVNPKDLKIGMKVKAVWKRPEERNADITDILYWKPY